jgi:tripartite-type tricarboxylate transporter receptor subunit TctC
MVDRLALVTNPLLYKKLSYDWTKDLKPVTNVGGVSLFLALKKDSPAKTFEEFIKLAKKTPGAINIGTGGKGHVTHLGMEALAQAEGVSFTYVPYKGVAPAMNALLAGEVDGMLGGGLVISQQSKAGKVKVVVTGADKRSDFLPDVPTLKEAGGKPGSIPSTAFTLVAPGTTPDALVAQINAAVAKVMEVPALRDAYQSRGLTVDVTSPQETLAQMNQEASRYKELVGKLGLQPE